MKKPIPAKKIGIVSGFGPLAGSDVLAKILAYSAKKYGAVEDYEYPQVALVSRGVKGFDEKATMDDKFLSAVLNTIDELDLLGADIIGIACNSAHIYYGQIAAYSKAPVVNLIYEVAKAAPKQGKSLLLSSLATKNAKIYTKALDKQGADYIVPNKNTQKLVDKAIHLVMANKLKEAKQKINSALMLETRKYDIIIAGCTELPLCLRFG